VLLIDREDAAIQNLRFGVAALIVLNGRQPLEGRCHERCIAHTEFLGEAFLLLVERLSFGISTLRGVQASEPADARHDVDYACGRNRHPTADGRRERELDVHPTERQATTRQRLPVEDFGLGKSPLHQVEIAQIVDGQADPRVVRTKGLFLNRQPLLEERLRLGVHLSVPIEEPEVGEAVSCLGMSGGQRTFPDCDGSSVERLGFDVLALLAVELGQVVEPGRNARVFRPERRLPRR
jgi:hypothetical protein